MKNDKERREFIDNPNNWEQVGEPIMGLVRMSQLTYKYKQWFKVEILQTYEHYNIKTGRMEPVREWIKTGIYEIDTNSRAFTYGISPTQMINAIKEIDKEERAK